mmetsp:Transcript_47922/g.155013  ORF Transcript_47922/g.155013 Transcript_47922/m.155013 type:complete len:343 (-) Transcript_47922:117-1145(-)
MHSNNGHSSAALVQDAQHNGGDSPDSVTELARLAGLGDELPKAEAAAGWEAAARDPLGEPVSFSELQPLSKLGAGEFCTVHSASFRGCMVALKRLRRDLPSCRESIGLADLQREIAILSRLKHPNIIRMVAHGTGKDGAPFCCLEMFSQPLSALLPTSTGVLAHKWEARQWPLARGLSVGLQLARALRHCHDEFLPGYRLFHRDIKPNNVGVFADGRVVLADFGLLALWEKDAADDDAARQLTGMTGSLRYMAPEVALSQPYNHKAEVFSWTSLLYHVLTLEKPFAKMDAKKFVLEACKNGMRCPLDKKWPAKLRAVMTEGWAGDPAARPDCRAVTEVLKTL